MSNYAKLKNPPVAEAIIELRTRMASPVEPERFDVFRDRLKEQFVKAQPIRFIASHLHLEEGAEVKSDVSHSVIGVRLDDAAGQWVLQAKSDGFTVSRLAPYESWDQLLGAVRELWPVYVEVFAPTAVIRLGVRYINLFSLPEGSAIDLHALLTKPPDIPDGLPTEVVEFMTRWVLPFKDSGIVLSIVQAPGEASIGVNAGKAGVVLDIDAICDQTFSPDWTAMWDKLELLRNAKNKAFFSCVTKQAWEQLT